MIYSETWHLILAGRKRRTTRRKYDGDVLTPRGVFLRDGRPRWLVGHTYAVQPERCHPALAHWKLLRIDSVDHPLESGEADALDEGFDSIAAFQATWLRLHANHPDVPTWALTFGDPKLTDAGLAVMRRAVELCGKETA